MKFFLDENFPKPAHTLLSERGHEVFDIRGTPEEGMDDTEIFERALDNGAAFLTTDGDFFHTVPHQYPRHKGVVVITLRQPNRESILQKLEWFLDHFSAEELDGRVFRLKDRTVVAHPPIDD
ncbi:MAG: DUF5615 family PIN-like protein [Planctomycetota bacterium]|nr:DUF5615 family PIN-like protein [Planctomycetota bacterium]MDA1140959.1 DUF5615 family PIN-like protein [Planctomycetota bacterium]